MKPKKLAVSWLTVTHLCNLRCKWCYQREQNAHGLMMNKDLSKRLVNLLSDLGVKVIVLIGGEPTLYHHYFTLIKYIKVKKMRTTVVTNALRFANPKFLEKTIRAGVHSITTSVKGFSREDYQRSTGNAGGYDAACQAIKRIEKSPIKQVVSITITRSVIENSDEMIRFMQDCGNNCFSLSFEKPCILADGKMVFDDAMMTDRIADKVQNKLYPKLIKTGLDFKMEFVCPHCQFPEEFIAQVEKDDHIFGGCLLLRSTGIVFDPQGSVLPCNHFVGFSLGKYGVDFSTSEEYYKWKESKTVEDFYHKTRQAPCEDCAICDRWDKCGAGCRLWWLYRGSSELIKKNVSPIKGVVS